MQSEVDKSAYEKQPSNMQYHNKNEENEIFPREKKGIKRKKRK
jgi:hypothetical protein